MSADVDVLVPVHQPSRPIARLAASVLSDADAPVRLLFIAHDTDHDGIRGALGVHAADPRVVIEAFSDGIRSPAGPLRHGLGMVQAPYFTKIDSDDRVADGALTSWLRTAARHRADIVLPRMREDGAAGWFPTPPRRRMRVMLDPVRDRLAYRTSTMGLISARFAQAAEPTPGLSVGEDVAPSVRLWFSGARICMAESAATYLVGADASDRTTEAVRPVADELAFIPLLLADPAWGALGELERSAVAVKILRVHLAAAVLRSARNGHLEVEIGALAGAARLVRDAAPRMTRLLSRADVRLLDELTGPAPDPRRAVELGTTRYRYTTPGALTTEHVPDLLHADAPLRFLAASVFARRWG